MRFIGALLQIWLLACGPSRAAPAPGRGAQPDYHLTVAGQERPSVSSSPDGALFQVAPGGQLVAVRAPFGKGLCLLGQDGVERSCTPRANGPFGFAPDGGTLAYASLEGVYVWDVATGEHRSLASTPAVDGLAWSKEGVVVRFRASGRHHLALLAVGSEKRLASAASIDAFAAAGPTIVYFRQGMICATDCRPLADSQPVVHAAVSPDGARVLFATDARVYLRDRDGTVRLLDELGRIHSLGFSGDGTSFLWASIAHGSLQTAGRTVRLPGSVSARFRHDAPGLVMASKRGAATLDPATGAETIVGGLTFPDGHTLDADMLAGKPIISYVRLPANVKKHAPLP